MLDDLAVSDTENIDNGAARCAIAAGGVHVQGNQVPFGNDLLDVPVLASGTSPSRNR